MTMAPGKKRSFWVEILFVSILVFLLFGARSQNHRRAEAAMKGLTGVGSHPTLFGAQPALK